MGFRVYSAKIAPAQHPQQQHPTIRPQELLGWHCERCEFGSEDEQESTADGAHDQGGDKTGYQRPQAQAPESRDLCTQADRRHRHREAPRR